MPQRPQSPTPNAIGRLTSVTETEGGTTVVRRTDVNYDLRGRVTSTARFIDGMTYTVRQTYDSLNRVATVTYPEPSSPEVVTNTYDFAGNLKTVQGLKSGVTTNYVTNIQYDAFGQRTQITFGNGTQTTYTYDPNAFRLQQLATTGPSGTLQNLSYTYDAVGNVNTIADGVNAAYNESFGYDDLHRLTGATGAYSALRYAYDQIGNMTCNSQLGPCTATSPNYAYPPSGATSVRPHAVNQAGPYTYTYDANGNMTGGAGRTLSYDVNNRPTSITAGGQTATFAYDYTGERVKKAVAGGTTTTYVGALYECSASCTKYIFAGSTRVALKAGTSVLYFHGNHLGSTHVVTDGAGAKVEEIHYYPYGATYSDTGAVGVTRKYTGQEFDPESGLYYYGARYYDPVLGRFISADGIGVRLGNPQSFNRYSYVLNNPLRYTDPTGHVECEGVWGCITAYAGAAWDWVKDTASSAWNTLTGWFGGGSGADGGGNDWFGQQFGQGTGGAALADCPGCSVLERFSPTRAPKPAGNLLACHDNCPGVFGGPVEGGHSPAPPPQDEISDPSFFGDPFTYLGLGVGGLGARGAAKATSAGTRVFRVWGDEAKPFGSSWTTVDPRTVPNFRSGAGLPDQNSGRFVSEGRLRDATGVTYGQAPPINPNHTGGLPELKIPHPQTQVDLDRVSGANPEF